MRNRFLSGLTTMRALLTGGIKAILAIAALSTAAHWALRVQRDAPPPVPAMASLPEPAVTGSIEPRRVERPALPKAADLKPADVRAAMAKVPDAKGLDTRFPDGKAADTKASGAKARQAASGLDQMHLSALIAGAGADRQKAPKPVAKAQTPPR